MMQNAYMSNRTRLFTHFMSKLPNRLRSQSTLPQLFTPYYKLDDENSDKID